MTIHPSMPLINRSAIAVPRYTSYPTANHFSPAVTAGHLRKWLGEIPAGSVLSLYVHVPFCRSLCWYCGCNTKMTRKAEPVTAYLDVLDREIAAVAAQVPAGCRVGHIHWGGGSPSLLDADAILRLAGRLRAHFDLVQDMAFAVEVDPRDLDAARADALAQAGVTRISLGVQDFDPDVQRAINRMQSFELTADAVAMMRARGVGSINIDLVYGLPHQTVQSVGRTIDQVMTLVPDRLAVFGYAHLPARIKHQRLIEDAALPGTGERLAQAREISRRIVAAGFREVGLDHFARPGDTMADGAVRRNFQGYTTDGAETLIGLGASAISRFAQGYAQNAVSVHDYARWIDDEGLATARGIVLSEDDRVRADVIESLMCAFELSRTALSARYGPAAADVLACADRLVAEDTDGLIEATDDGIRMTAAGRPFVRTVCAAFDRYLTALGRTACASRLMRVT